MSPRIYMCEICSSAPPCRTSSFKARICGTCLEPKIGMSGRLDPTTAFRRSPPPQHASPVG
ncbi:hypothetical protein PLICRDRAFT_41670 [Plicaturopsis crispa FD-325 SS-3]|nr:hypothetical protein PLICRDRAFT_41670 [Plicaturopsis crispa FD-325 SS-3]